MSSSNELPDNASPISESVPRFVDPTIREDAAGDHSEAKTSPLLPYDPLPTPPFAQRKAHRNPKTIDPNDREGEQAEDDAEGYLAPPPPAPPVPPSVNVLILVTGSVAAIKLGVLLDQFEGERCSIRIAATKSAFYFIHRAQRSKNPIPFQSIVTDDDEWKQWEVVSDAVVHIELRRWADMVLIAPLDANSLAKISNGLCDNLVTCVMRAWEVGKKPVMIAPAMNTAMWMHPVTRQQVETLRQWYSVPGHSSAYDSTRFCPVQKPGDAGSAACPAGPATALPETLEEGMFQVLWPVCKRLACGDVGIGGMASVEEIVRGVRHTMELIRSKKLEDIMPL